jgi:hypothetical protein
MMAFYAEKFPGKMAGVLRPWTGPNVLLKWSKPALDVFGGIVAQFGESAVFPNWQETFKGLQSVEQALGAQGKEVQVELRLVTGASSDRHCSVLLCSPLGGLVGFRVL